MKKKYSIIALLIFITIGVSAQQLFIKVENKPLNEVLIEIRDQYNLSLSFDDNELSKYFITANQTFTSAESAFSFLFKDIPFIYEKVEDVFLFYPKKQIFIAPKTYRISGKIYDAENFESLPYSNVLINGIGTISDEFGNFNFESKIDSIFQFKISYLGYQLHDTTLTQGTNFKIGLSSAMINMPEIIVSSSQIFFSEQTGSKAGLMRINHKIAQFIPGNGDNSIFNVLRLQPGILAAGEQSSEMLIWGSYQGQSQVNFDGITLFGLKNYNDNISTVNPYMAKDIRIHKGGFDASMGERVGGIIDITGIEGDKQKPGFNFNLNNMTMNLLAETPLGNNASLVGAYRQTYYNLYSPYDVKSNQSTNTHFSNNTIIVKPDYVFRDGNLKYSGQTNQGDSYQFSTFWGQDNFSYSIDQSHINTNIDQNLDEKNRRYGARAQFNKLWAGRGSSQLSISYSGLQSDKYDIQNSSGMGMNNSMQSMDISTQNNITELKFILTGKHRLSAQHELEYGSGFINNTTLVREESNDISTVDIKDKGSQIMTYIQDQFAVSKILSFTYGFRTDYSTNLKKYYLQPRLSLAFKPTNQIQFNASWGIYNQFIVYNSVVDQNNNYRYQWMVSDGKEIPILTSQHYVLGGVFNQNGFTLSVESYYKNTQGMTRFLSTDTERTLYTGKSKAMGIDFFIKQEYKGHSFWASYSLSQTLEWFPFFESSNYEAALHDQLHEIKIAGIINLSPFYISANYVYGTGFPPSSITVNEEEHPYSRIDIAGIYRFFLKDMKIETGLSILNLLNRENIKYSNIIQIPTDGESTVGIYSEAVPFTPTLFLNISL